MGKELEYTRLHEKILVVHNTLSDPQGLIDFYIAKSDEWVPWYTFGDMMVESGASFTWSEFPSKEEWEEKISSPIREESPDDVYKVEVGEVWHKSSALYKELTGINLPMWEPTAWSLARYFEGAQPMGPHSGVTMNPHTDYQQDMKEAPGYQPHITGVLYPNDDYEGGEIFFRKFSDTWDDKTFEKPEFELTYKPKAGDLVIFPSTHPFYHGVMNVKKSPKYIYRLYWRVWQEATELYKSLSEKYGSEWESLESDRKKRADTMYRDKWSQSIRIPFAEYYKMYESGTLPPLWDHRPSDDYRGET